MESKRKMTAAELMAKLQADPDFQRRSTEKDRKRAEREARLAAIAGPIMDDLRGAGVVAASIEEMTQKYAPLAPEIVNVLLDWLPRVPDDRLKESLIRALGAARDPFDGRALVECFLSDTSETLRWPIANTIAAAQPFGINDWLIEAVQNRSFGTAREMLVIALGRLAPPEASLPVLLSVLDELPGHVAMAMGEVGGANELNALQSRLDDVGGWKKAAFLKAIRKLNGRLRGTA